MSTNLKFFPLSDFKGGLVTNVPTTEVGINQSPDLDNVLILERGFSKRYGDSAFNSSAMNSGANVQGLTFYKPVSATDYLVAVCGAKIYKSEMDGTMDEITGAVSVTANQNNIWTFTKLKDLCIGVGGAPDAPFKWSGSGDAAALGGSPVSGKFCFQARDRVFIGGPTAAPSTVYWPILSNPEDWSGTGSGNTTIETNDGDILVGGVALNNDIALLFKNYSIHHLLVGQYPFPSKLLMQGVGACGKNAIVKANDGLVYFVTNEPRMRATDGYSIIDFPDTIDDIWNGLSRTRLPYIQGIYYPDTEQIHWICSYGSSSTNNYCIVYDIRHKCWLRYTTGFDCNVVCLAQGYRLFGGHTNGVIYEKHKSGVYQDASESSANVNGYWTTPWINNEDNDLAKQIRYMVLNFDTQSGLGDIYYSYGFNFSPDAHSGTVVQKAPGGLWDVDLWDSTFIWGGQNESQKRIYMYGRGNNVQVKVGCKDNTAMMIHSITFASRGSGRKELQTT
jgi:hypothetical protein